MVSFQYDVTHRVEKITFHADGLMRSDHLPEPESCESEEQEMSDETLANIREQMNNGSDTKKY